MPESMTPLIILGVVGALFILLLSLLTNNYSLNNIKSKTVGDGQYGTARWATTQEIKKTFANVPFDVTSWREGKDLPKVQGLILGSTQRGKQLDALVDRDDVHCLMIGASGVGKTAFFLYPNLEFACASGMSYLALDTKGDLARNYGTIAKKYYGYHVSVIDLRNPTRSDGSNLLTLINRYMDIAREHPDNLAARAKAEKYAKILAKTIVNPGGDDQDRGQNAFFYDAAEGLLTSVILLLAEYVPPDSSGHEKRHIVSVFKLVQELLAPSGQGKKTGFQVLMDNLPSTHKARWFAGAALNTSEQGMASVMSTVLSRLNAFLDSELEQVLCFDSAIDAEHFAAEKSAIFLVLPEEDSTKNFMAGLMIQNLSRELFSVADEHGGKLQNRVVFYCDELGTMPPFDILPLFSAGRSRKLTLVPIIQSLAQLEKNYGKEGAEIISDNCQDTIFGGFAPNSQTAETLSKALGSRTVLTGSVSRGKDSNSQSLQMVERALLSPDELKSLPKGNFIVMKTGTHPMRTKLQLYFKWGISFEEPYQVPERAQREVYYAGKEELLMNIKKSLYSQPQPVTASKPDGYMSSYAEK
jgi:type IV secretion system protein VirD4